MKAIRLRTGYLTDPIGIDLTQPLLTWIADGGRKQTAYAVTACVNGEPVLDTGKILSSSMRFSYPLELHSRDIVTWNVVLWDEDGRACEASDTASFEAGLLEHSDWSARWIRGDYKVNKKKRYPVDHFRKTFDVRDVRKARLYISALGLYEAYINGEKVGRAVLAPGSTDPRVRVQYDTYDVTGMLREGQNEITLLLADGWYRGSIGAKGFTYVFGKETKVISQLEITDGAGNVAFVVTDGSWQWSSDGPIRFADLKDGETVDNRMTASFGGHAVETEYGGKMTCSNSTHVTEIAQSAPVSITKTKTGKTTLTYANNTAGSIAFRVNAHAGD
ncbi:MAG: alpha-L-rhamnosidase N-terminal domain-containing protein, partial [Clostridia bacterium]|nr:alpha-L-rhamnosidase N-terminal domain-containing protein [Clostridia bacterium]